MDNLKKGMDVSHYQGDINWDEVAKTDIKFAFMKASEADAYHDPMFASNWNSAKKHLIKTGAYHFFIADVDYTKQVFNLITAIQQVKFNKDSDYLIVDAEPRSTKNVPINELTENLRKLLLLIEHQFGCKPLIYTNNSFWNNKVDYKKYDFTKYGLWVANWDVPKPQIPGNWTDWVCWQHSSKGVISGIKGDVDLDLMKI